MKIDLTIFINEFDKRHSRLFRAVFHRRISKERLFPFNIFCDQFVTIVGTNQGKFTQTGGNTKKLEVGLNQGFAHLDGLSK